MGRLVYLKLGSIDRKLRGWGEGEGGWWSEQVG